MLVNELSLDLKCKELTTLIMRAFRPDIDEHFGWDQIDIIYDKASDLGELIETFMKAPLETEDPTWEDSAEAIEQKMKEIYNYNKEVSHA